MLGFQYISGTIWIGFFFHTARGFNEFMFSELAYELSETLPRYAPYESKAASTNMSALEDRQCSLYVFRHVTTVVALTPTHAFLNKKQPITSRARFSY